MDRIVYIFGAGFSAPLGLPVTSNFLEKSKDLYSSDQVKFGHFKLIYELIRDLANLKNYIYSDLLNIEEILSILEMGYFVKDNKKEISEYKRFIKDVIKNYTPIITFNERHRDDTSWDRFCFGDARPFGLYGYFIANLFQIRIIKKRGERDLDNKLLTNLELIDDKNNQKEYGLITLNYDRIIENIVDFINEKYIKKSEKKLSLENKVGNYERSKIKYAKLHGCVSGEIVLPTWNKKDSEHILKTWRLAHKLLREANEIRIIGYSLPVSDNYIRYLIANALKDSEHLKKIDIITIDGDGITEKRYRELFNFNNFKYKNENILKLLSEIYSAKLKRVPPGLEELTLNSVLLEKEHRDFMDRRE